MCFYKENVNIALIMQKETLKTNFANFDLCHYQF